MRKFLIFLFFSAFFANICLAQDVIDIGQDLGKTASQVKEAEEDGSLFDMLGTGKNAADDKNKNQSEEQEQNDKGIFAKISGYLFGEDAASSVEIKKDQHETQEDFADRLETQAEEGDLRVQKALAYIYLYGKSDFPVDYEKAFKYYNMAAAQGDATALNNLGSLYFNGIGVSVNYQRAIELFEAAVKAGSSEAALNLGFIYLSGRNASNNAAHAVELFKIAAERNNIIAKFMLGYAYYRGFGVTKNLNQAATLIKEAADADFDEAQYILGYMYLNGFGVVKNYKNAKSYFTYAMKQGNMSAMMMLADKQAEGTQLEKNEFEAYIGYSIASVMGEKSAPKKRDDIEPQIKREALPQAQAIAENFKAKPTEITQYTRKTFGSNIRGYIDENIKKK